MDRHWLITWTCYGTWLPGDARGFVGNVRDADGTQVNHNIPGTPYDADIHGLKAYVLHRMKGEPVVLDISDADILILQFQETARIRKWKLHATSVMFNHVHIVVSVLGDPEPESILETLKNWRRGLSRKYGTCRPMELFGLQKDPNANSTAGRPFKRQWCML